MKWKPAILALAMAGLSLPAAAATQVLGFKNSTIPARDSSNSNLTLDGNEIAFPLPVVAEAGALLTVSIDGEDFQVRVIDVVTDDEAVEYDRTCLAGEARAAANDSTLGATQMGMGGGSCDED